MGQHKFNANILADKLFHYCSEETFRAIIRNKTIRFTDVSTTNDPLEIHVGIKEISNVADILIEGEMAKHSEIIKEIKENIETFLAEKMILISCFSALEDDKSMWQEYGAGGTGACIGFHPAAISKIPNTVVSDVRYLNKNETEDLKDTFSSVISSISNRNITSKIHRIYAANPILDYLFLLKAKKWHHEQEIRAIIFLTKPHDDEKKRIFEAIGANYVNDLDAMRWKRFINRRGTEVAYEDIQFGRYLPGQEMRIQHGRSIKSVTLGNKCLISIENAASMLNDAGYIGVSVRKSNMDT